jgi:hypothetical protein
MRKNDYAPGEATSSNSYLKKFDNYEKFIAPYDYLHSYYYIFNYNFICR